jgi:hypothetical protein
MSANLHQIAAELRDAAGIVARSYDASVRPPWPAIVVLDEVLRKVERPR